jgi:hypothetical protein
MQSSSRFSARREASESSKQIKFKFGSVKVDLELVKGRPLIRSSPQGTGIPEGGFKGLECAVLGVMSSPVAHSVGLLTGGPDLVSK